MRKIKLFLGAYIDSINAQDINCFNIAKYIDKSLFEVHALVFNEKVEIPGIICHKVHTNRLLKNIDKFKIMWRTDIDLYYLPRVEKVDILFAKMKNKKIISSVEIQTVYTKKLYYKFFNKYITDYFCISNFLNKKNKKHWNKIVDVLYLGVDTSLEVIKRKAIKNVVFIGSITKRKRPQLFLKLAKEFADLHFIMIGDGNLLQSIKKEAAINNINNIEFLGKVANSDVLDKLKRCDLLVMTSRQEGLPKVVLEAASKSVPTIYISQFYQIDYIINGINGFEAKDIEEVKQIICKLLYDEKLYQNICKNAYATSIKYSWGNLIKQYESFFVEVLKNN